jgi:uncharacterized caspase-like protein
MTKNWALVIGVNYYNFMQPLKYAQRDAQLIQSFLCNQAGFERVFLFSDNLHDIGKTSTRPYYANLLRCLQQLSEKPLMESGDNFWFFFSGHGIMHANSDYLMLADSNPEDIENTAISISYVIQHLQRCGSDNVILILDACRHHHKETAQGFGRQTQEIANQSKIISILSCHPHEYSYEIDALQTGAFTHALLEGLGVQGQCSTVKRLNQYLSFRVPQLAHQYKNAQQTPYFIVQPIAKFHLIFISKYASLHDINTLKLAAFQADIDGDFELAEQLWMRVNAAETFDNLDAIESIQKFTQLQVGNPDIKSNFTSQDFLGGKIDYPLITEERLGAVGCVGENLKSHQEIQPTLTTFIPYKYNSANLYSQKGVDYKQLRKLLAGGKWKQADQETIALMLKVANRETEGWLDIESINKFPYADLCIIDQLWLKYSNGRFGFSVQKQIWESVGGQPSADYETWCKFCDRIGWRSNHNWLFYSDLNFSTNASLGHLPAAGIVHVLTPWKGWVVGLFCCLVGFSALAYKLEQNQRMLLLYNSTSDAD